MSSSSALSARGSGLALLVVGLCWLAVLFDGLDMFIYGSVLPHMLEEKALGITSVQAGDLGSYATFGMLVGALAAGTVADRVGRKKLMVSCVTLFSLARIFSSPTASSNSTAGGMGPKRSRSSFCSDSKAGLSVACASFRYTSMR